MAKDITSHIKAMAGYFDVELDDDGLEIWTHDLMGYSIEEVRWAFGVWRSDKTPTGYSKLLGETWPRSARIRAIIDDQRQRMASANGTHCSNPECMDGWVTAYWKPAGQYGAQNRFVKRCPACHPGKVA